MAPDEALLRDQQPELGKPVLLDEMLERQRRRVDRMIDVVHRLGRRRIDGERMQCRPIFAGLDDRALRSGGGSRSANGTVASSVVRSTETGIPASERAAIAPRRRRRKFFSGMRTALRQSPCSERLTRTRVAFSTLPEAA